MPRVRKETRFSSHLDNTRNAAEMDTFLRRTEVRNAQTLTSQEFSVLRKLMGTSDMGLSTDLIPNDDLQRYSSWSQAQLILRYVHEDGINFELIFPTLPVPESVIVKVVDHRNPQVKLFQFQHGQVVAEALKASVASTFRTLLENHSKSSDR